MAMSLKRLGFFSKRLNDLHLLEDKTAIRKSFDAPTLVVASDIRSWYVLPFHTPQSCSLSRVIFLWEDSILFMISAVSQDRQRPLTTIRSHFSAFFKNFSPLFDLLDSLGAQAGVITCLEFFFQVPLGFGMPDQTKPCFNPEIMSLSIFV
jgi:hypothetical protein